MPQVLPSIPSTITVHLGPPNSNAANVTVDFVDYIKNVASSEIYPTWEPAALRANILAIISFALNRVYTEYYRSRGYPFDITSSTAYDQSYVPGRNVFENISQLVDDLFNSYLRRTGFVEPLAAKFCNGTTSTCDGLSQWGSQALAQDGYNSIEILRAYYGDDIEVVTNAPVTDITQSYPGTPLRQGDSGPNVVVIQVALNRISQNYPAISKINPVSGIFDEQTEQSVRQFQQIFDLTVDGIVGQATWYALVRLYVAVEKLAELQSEGQQFYYNTWELPAALSEGSFGARVTHLQYMLSVLADFVPQISAPAVNGYFGPETRQAVLAFQQWQDLPQTGTVTPADWDAIYSQFSGIEERVFQDLALFPEQTSGAAQTSVRGLQLQLNQVAQSYPDMAAVPVSGIFDRRTQQAVAQLQKLTHLPVTGRPDPPLRQQLQTLSQDLHHTRTSRHTQYPGFALTLGKQDPKEDMP